MGDIPQQASSNWKHAFCDKCEGMYKYPANEPKPPCPICGPKK